MLARTTRLGLAMAAVAALTLSVGCSEPETGGPVDDGGPCVANDDCASGEVCDAGVCLTVCATDDQCVQEGYACQQGACRPCDGCRTTPNVLSIDGTGSPDATNGGNHLRGSIVLRGENLDGAWVTLSGGDFINELLDPCAAGTDTELEVELPATVAANVQYTLRVSNQAGSCDATLQLLQGERGPAGEYLIGAGLVDDGTTLSVSFGTGAGTVAEGNDPRLRSDGQVHTVMAGADHRNLARNGGFTDGTVPLNLGVSADVLPRHFVLWDPSGTIGGATDPGVTVLQDGTVSPWSIEISDGSPGDPAFGIEQMLFRPGAVPPNLAGRTVTAAVWVKKTAGTDSGVVGIADAGAQGAENATWVDAGGSTDWHRLTVSHTVSAGPEYLKVILAPGNETGDGAAYAFNGLMVSFGLDGPSWRPHRLDAPMGGSASGSTGAPAASCLALHTSLAAPSGVYYLDPNGGDPGDGFYAWCEMGAGGGWTRLRPAYVAYSWQNVTCGGADDTDCRPSSGVGAEPYMEFPGGVVGVIDFVDAHGSPIAEDQLSALTASATDTSAGLVVYTHDTDSCTTYLATWNYYDGTAATSPDTATCNGGASNTWGDVTSGVLAFALAPGKLLKSVDLTVTSNWGLWLHFSDGYVELR